MFGRDGPLTDREIDERARSLRNQMSLKEKVWLLNGNWDPMGNMITYRGAYNPVPVLTNGNRRLGVPPVAFSDGPRGVVVGHSTCFPMSMAREASFDRNLERRVADAIGRELRARGDPTIWTGRISDPLLVSST